MCVVISSLLTALQEKATELVSFAGGLRQWLPELQVCASEAVSSSTVAPVPWGPETHLPRSWAVALLLVKQQNP